MATLLTMQYFSTLLGQRMVMHEFNWLKQQLRTCVGTHALLISTDPYGSFEPLFSDFYMLTKATKQQHEHSSFCCRFDAIPLPNKSMDVAVVHHAFGGSARSIDILREAERVLVPGGRLFVISENPISLMGLLRLVSRSDNTQYTNAPMVPIWRMQEWLAALDIQVQSRQTVFHELPFNRHWVLRKTARLASWCAARRFPFGGVYCLAAIKSARPVNPLRLRKTLWQPRVAGTQVASTQVQGKNESN